MQLPHPPQELRSARVLVRFILRLAILMTFAGFSGNSFVHSFAALLWMTILLSAVVGTMKQERPFDSVLNNWDEAAAYGALFCLVHGFAEAAPI